LSYLYSERITEYENEGLGLKRNSVEHMKHNIRWRRVFSRESYLIQHQLNIESLYLYHCGSTSVPGISAKPIIDIVGSVCSLEKLDRLKSKLEKIGYEYKGEYGIEGRRYCVLYDPKKQNGYVHLHIYKQGTQEIKDHLIFRDHLRLNAATAKEYESFKLNLNVPRPEYSDSKRVIIQKILNDAKLLHKKIKTIVILGAAQGGGNTARFIQSEYPGAETVELEEKNLLAYDYNGYKTDDGFNSIISKIIEFDQFVLATPVYWYSMSGIMKKIIDRFSDLLVGEGKVLGDKLNGKKIRVIATGSDEEIPNV